MKRFQARVKNVWIYYFSDFYQKFVFSSLRESGAYGLTFRELKLVKMIRALKITYDRGFKHPNWSNLSREIAISITADQAVGSKKLTFWGLTHQLWEAISSQCLVRFQQINPLFYTEFQGLSPSFNGFQKLFQVLKTFAEKENRSSLWTRVMRWWTIWTWNFFFPLFSFSPFSPLFFFPSPLSPLPSFLSPLSSPLDWSSWVYYTSLA